MRIFLDFPEGCARSDLIVENLFQHRGLNPSIEVSNVHFSHDESDVVLFEQVTFQIKPGSLVAIVGASGQGKTSLVNLLLGLLEPSKGTISISGMSPLHAITSWPGGIAYLPQRPELLNGSIRDNIVLGWKHSHDLDTRVFDALEKAQLSQFVTSLPGGIDTQIKDLNLSGGELQRLGIARAMFTKPKLLVLDEATSSLDSQTEEEVSLAIKSLRGEVTVVMIAHRLSTVKSADSVVYLDKGKVISMGSFEKVRTVVSDFDTQAKLMGL
jgi:ABC-type multidrug transport system fused ATPase/permease subunit